MEVRHFSGGLKILKEETRMEWNTNVMYNLLHIMSFLFTSKLLTNKYSFDAMLMHANDEYLLFMTTTWILPHFHLLPARSVLPLQSIVHCFRRRLMKTFEERKSVRAALHVLQCFSEALMLTASLRRQCI
mmetsp:Transcript_3166/g.4752  ORF Transcript_3166/g.4752 Transcript_3166/m.4752 type:complete len:130 (-) Transcript_3166:1123-1512(-)